MTGTPIWGTSIVTLSFAYPFLLQSLFSLSALHLVFLHSSSNPTLSKKYIQTATLHHLKRISLFRDAIQNITPENSNACCACAWFLSLHAWTTPGGKGANLFFDGAEEIAWYKLHRGGNEVVKSAFHWGEKGPLLEMIGPWVAISLPAPIPPLLESVENAKLDYIAESWTGADICTEDKVSLEETLQALRYVFTLVEVMGIEFSACVPTLSWTTLIPERFCEMVEDRRPQALILVAIYCVLLKRIEKFWWIRGKAENLLAAVTRELPDVLVDKWLKWPMEEIEGNGKVA